MSLNTDHSSRAIPSRRPSAFRYALPIACALTSCLGVSQSSAAAEIDLAGIGTFKSPSAEQLANLPVGMAFSQADLTSGIWSFLVRYDDQTADTDPEPYVGRYDGAIRLSGSPSVRRRSISPWNRRN